ncbi:MAG: hypothetical protein PVF20_02875 [Desulfobacterales bacterium]
MAGVVACYHIDASREDGYDTADSVRNRFRRPMPTASGPRRFDRKPIPITASSDKDESMLKPNRMRLYSGGHEGAEEEFGKNAERHGIREITFSFEGNRVARQRGVTILSPDALKKGAISMEIVSMRMGRSYTREKEILPILQTLFHIVNMGYQVFSVGWIRPDLTVKGGTGWGVELAKWFNRPLSVYDQERCAWFTWTDNTWKSDEPAIRFETFAGTGTRSITEDGRRAVKALFDRSIAR